MLFNIVLLPMQAVIIYMAMKIYRDPKKFHFETKEISKSHEGLLDEKYIRKYNKIYTIPFLFILHAILLIMSISTILYSKEQYHNYIMGGFALWFIVCVIFFLITRYSINKEIHKN